MNMEKSSTLKPSRFKFVIIYILFLFLVVEIFLQVQQRMGPLCDLEWTNLNFEFASSIVNHTHATNLGYTKDGVEISPGRPFTLPDSAGAAKILFMGDSFLEGYPHADTIPQFIWNYFNQVKKLSRPFLLWNAGCTSYSPLIYTVQSKILIPKYRPDLLVLDIDETDLIDDYAFYRHLTIRDSGGKVERIDYSPPLKTKMDIYGDLKKIPFYTIRAIMMWIQKARLYFIFENYNQKYKAKYLRHPLSRPKNSRFMVDLAASFDEDKNSDSKYSEEIIFFEKTVRELLKTLIKETGDKNKILLIHHPHIYQLVPDQRGFLWKNRTQPIVQKLCAEYGITYYDAAPEMKKMMGNQIENYYRPNDIHFNAQGLKVYAELVAGEVLLKLTSGDRR